VVVRVGGRQCDPAEFDDADYTDPTMTTLTAPDGPFAECSGETHAAPPPLPVLTPDWLTAK